MALDRTTAVATTVRTRWTALERDWQSVVVGALIAGLVGALELHVPW